VLNDVVPRDRHRAARGRHKSGHDAHRGGLSRAVWPEEPEDFAGGDLKTNPIDRRNRAVTFGQIADMDHTIIGRWFYSKASGFVKTRTGHHPYAAE
jgi:hypothetical protein